MVPFIYHVLLLIYIISFLVLGQPGKDECNQTYSDELIPCKPEYDRCSVENSNETVNGMNCYCDMDCDLYNDCCSNFGYVSSSRSNRHQLFSCYKNPSGLYPSHIYVYTACPINWKDEETRHSCESDSELIVTKPFQAVPVTNPNNSKTYKNIYCAICNGEDTKNLIRWVTTINCGINWKSRSPYVQSLSEAVRRKLLHFNKTDSTWYLMVDYNDPPTICSTCITSALPSMDLPLRRCEPYISTCSNQYDNEIIKQRCKLYTAYRYVKQGSEIITYKNKDCAKCNFVTTKDMHCKMPAIDFVLSNNICYGSVFATFSCLYEPFIKNDCILGFFYNSHYKKCMTA